MIVGWVEVEFLYHLEVLVANEGDTRWYFFFSFWYNNYKYHSVGELCACVCWPSWL